MLRIVLVVGVALAVARGALYAAGDALITVPESQIHDLYVNNEALLHLNTSKPPKIILIGTSRLGVVNGECLAPYVGGIEADDVMNYSLAANTPWRTLTFFRRNPDVLAETDHVVIDLLPFQLSVSPMFDEEDELFLRLATVQERMRVREPALRAKAMADLVFPMWSERHTVSGWKFGLAQLPRSREERFTAAIEAMKQANLVRARQADTLEMEPGAATAEGYTPPTVVSQVQVEALRELAELLPADCTLHLVWLPVRDDFAAWLEDDAEARERLRAFRALIERAGAARVRVQWHEDANALGYVESDFMDVVHYTDAGRDKVCALLAADLRGGQ